jgi:hypothetical protein
MGGGKQSSTAVGILAKVVEITDKGVLVIDFGIDLKSKAPTFYMEY